MKKENWTPPTFSLYFSLALFSTSELFFFFFLSQLDCSATFINLGLQEVVYRWQIKGKYFNQRLPLS